MLSIFRQAAAASCAALMVSLLSYASPARAETIAWEASAAGGVEGLTPGDPPAEASRLDEAASTPISFEGDEAAADAASFEPATLWNAGASWRDDQSVAGFDLRVEKPRVDAELISTTLEGRGARRTAARVQ